MRLRIALVVVACAALQAACTTPPEKEMDQARKALETARAAGADQYAPDEYNAAAASLKHSEDAAQQRDYRQALNYALDSREQAQNAARTAANQKVAVRDQVERDLRDLQPLLNQALAKLKSVEAPRARRSRTPQTARQTIEAARRSVQEARTAMTRQDYAGARNAIRGVSDRLHAAIHEIDAAAQPPATRRRR